MEFYFELLMMLQIFRYKEFNISLEAMKEEVFGKTFHPRKNYTKFEKNEPKPVEKIKNIENGEKFVEETFIKLLLECLLSHP